MIRSLLNSLLYFPSRGILETPEQAGLDYRDLRSKPTTVSGYTGGGSTPGQSR